MSQKINVAIVGTGMSLAVFHRPSIIFLSDKFNLHTVVERSGKGRAKEVCGESVKVVKTLEEVVEDKEVDLVSCFSLFRSLLPILCADISSRPARIWRGVGDTKPKHKARRLVLNPGRHFHPEQHPFPIRETSPPSG